MNDSFVVKVKTTTGSADFDVSISPSDAIEVLIERVREKFPASDRDKKIRLVCAGKMLAPPSSRVSDFKISSGTFIHAILSTNQGTSSSSGSTAVAGAYQPSRGLDRLSLLGLSVDEVAAIRSSFRDSIAEFVGGQTPSDGETAQAFRHRMEEAWMQSQGPTSEFIRNLPRSSSSNGRNSRNSGSSSTAGAAAATVSPDLEAGATTTTAAESNETITALRALLANPSTPPAAGYEDNDGLSDRIGTNLDFWWGFSLGFMLGIIMLFCTWDRNVNVKQRLGILTGITFKIFFSHLYEDSNQAQLHRQQQQHVGGGVGSGGAGAVPPGSLDGSGKTKDGLPDGVLLPHNLRGTHP